MKFIKEDTDRYEDYELGLNVDPKEYKKQKSKQLSLSSKVKLALKNVVKKVNEEMNKKSEYLTKKNLEEFGDDVNGWKWIYEEHEVNEETLKEAFEEGLELGIKNNNYLNNEEIRAAKVSMFFKKWLPKVKKILEGGYITVYRGIHLSDKDKVKLEDCLKHNLMERNSWTYNKDVAINYASYGKFRYDDHYLLEMKCSISNTNLLFSAWLEGYWGTKGSSYAYGANDEINLKKMMNIKGIKITKI